MKLVLAALSLVVAVSAQPLQLHPENPHYFQFDGKPVVLITSGEHYGALLNKDFDYERYLDTLHSNRLNLTRVFSGSYREVQGNFEIKDNTLAPAPDKFITPWLQRDGKFDLTRWDEAYFTRLKKLVSYARRKDVIVELVLFCPLYEDSMWLVSPMNILNNLNGVGDVARTDVLALKNVGLTEVQDSMVRKIVSELREFDNVYYEICNEPYFQGVTLAWQAHIAQLISETEASFAKKHLIAQNWANGSTLIDRPDPLVSLYNFHYSRPPASVAMNWNLKRAIGNNETGFDGASNDTYRIQAWDFLMAGGALFNNLDYSFTVGHEDGTFAPPAATPGGGSATLRRQLEYLRVFFDQIPFWRMQPTAEDTVRGPAGASIRALEESGKIYAVYIHHGHAIKDGKPAFQLDTAAASRQLIVHLPRGKYVAKWRDTRTGLDLKVEQLEVTSPGNELRLASPVYSEDIALVLRAVNASGAH